MATQLINTADTSAVYLGITYEDSTKLIVELNPVSIEKKADKLLWIDTSPLTYTVTIKNNDPEEGGDPLTDVTFEDHIDPKIALLDVNNVTVNGQHKTIVDDFTYDSTTGMLVFEQLDDIPAGGSAVIMFPVTKV